MMLFFVFSLVRYLFSFNGFLFVAGLAMGIISCRNIRINRLKNKLLSPLKDDFMNEITLNPNQSCSNVASCFKENFTVGRLEDCLSSIFRIIQNLSLKANFLNEAFEPWHYLSTSPNTTSSFRDKLQSLC